MLAFIYLVHQMMAMLIEIVPALELTLDKLPGAINKYRTAIEDEDFRDQEILAGAACRDPRAINGSPCPDALSSQTSDHQLTRSLDHDGVSFTTSRHLKQLRMRLVHQCALIARIQLCAAKSWLRFCLDRLRSLLNGTPPTITLILHQRQVIGSLASTIGTTILAFVIKRLRKIRQGSYYLFYG
jgi:hypothetical protein